MKKHLCYAVMGIGLLWLGLGCTKTGSVGPAGATGTQGAVGPAGADGTVIYSGTTAPVATTGNTGDFYLDLTSEVLYGPKTASGWGTGFSLMGTTGSTGATGATGKAGSQIYSGTTVPASTLGAIGDYYLDENNYWLYGPKVAAGWGTPITLQGPAGTANVQYTPWFEPPSYTKDTVFGIYGFYYNEAVPAISQSIVDQGTVVVYGKLDGYVSTIWPTNQIAIMPISITYMDGSSPNTDTWSALITAGNVQIQLVSSLNAYGSISNAHQFRCVIIPGGVSIPAGISFEALLRYLRVPTN